MSKPTYNCSNRDTSIELRQSRGHQHHQSSAQYHEAGVPSIDRKLSRVGVIVRPIGRTVQQIVIKRWTHRRPRHGSGSRSPFCHHQWVVSNSSIAECESVALQERTVARALRSLTFHSFMSLPQEMACVDEKVVWSVDNAVQGKCAWI